MFWTCGHFRKVKDIYGKSGDYVGKMTFCKHDNIFGKAETF